ncbi:hypothetical protein HIM_06289 [Hirsutella minnesotensis 3608]|uniref:glucan endo-1,3-beta-D-glucosidase n=1 Tax=Hirsutella minnesotensis 3608 TaxID=1043627 RepID=A0A0F7ZU57_9HYPO|nr:hypothetical protein HIM_06289 [Hirsutella minnesotensis 3608]
MNNYPHGDPYERQPLDSYAYDGPSQHPAVRSHAYQGYSGAHSPYHDDVSPQRVLDSSSSSSSRSRGYPQHYTNADYDAPPPPRHADHGYYSAGAPSRGPGDAMTYGPQHQPAAGGMAGLAYNVTDYDARGAVPVPMHSTSQIPPPPSRALRPDASRQQMPHYSAVGASPYDPYGNRSHAALDQDSHSSLNPFGTPPATHSPSRSLNSFGRPSSFADDPYAYSSNHRQEGANLGVVDPHAIEDDGDDGLDYQRRPQRNSMFGAPSSKSGARAAAAGAGAGLGAEAATRGLRAGASQEKPSEWLKEQKGRSKKWKWIIIILVFLIIAAAIVGGVVGSMVMGNKKGKSSSDKSAADDTKENGDLSINSAEIKALMNNKDLHKVFPGMDYTPYNTQYPDCVSNPPSQNNVTRDVAVLSQLTNKIRLYGTDCNQTEMVIHAVKQLKMEKDIKIWMGVWQDGNDTTNKRQLEQMWTILDTYGADPFEGIIVANEILFRKEMTISSLSTVLSDVRTKLSSKNIKLPVATSDLGDDWTAELAKDSDYVMANIHPFFAGVSADIAASWTWTFWEGKDGPFWKSDKNKNIIAETGWPSDGGKNCGESKTTSCEPGSVAGIKEMNTFMNSWVCQALTNGTQYFWFEAFDEPWKVRFNEKGKEWEDKWGLMGLDRKLKDGIKIPDCGGKTVS